MKNNMIYCPRCASVLAEKEDGGRVRPACPDDACGYIYYDNPTPVVAALVEHEGDIILARNAAWTREFYGLITGFLEQGETPEDAVLRELEEELGLIGTIVSMIGVYAFFRFNQLIVVYHIRAEGVIVLGEELSAIKRVPPDRLEPWPAGTGLAVRDWLARRTET
jgi:NADH pyrophosphatase NudC (nudix superfamily)